MDKLSEGLLTLVDGVSEQVPDCQLDFTHGDSTVTTAIEQVQALLGVALDVVDTAQVGDFTVDGIPELVPQVASKVTHELGLDVDVVSLGREKLRMLSVVLGERRTLTVGQIRDLGGNAVDAIWVNRKTTDVRYLGCTGTVVFHDTGIELHPARNGLATVRGFNSFGEQPPRHLDRSNDLIGLDLGLEGFQREERVVRVVRVSTNIATHQKYGVDLVVSGLTRDIERGSQQGTDELSHGAHTITATVGGQGPELGRNTSQLGVLERNQSIVGTLILFGEDRIGFVVLTLDEASADGRLDGLSVRPGDLEDGCEVSVHTRLEESGSLDGLIDLVVIVARENDGKVKVAAGAVIVGHVEVLQGQRHIAVVLRTFQDTLVLRQCLPGVADGGTTEGTGWIPEVLVQGRVIGEDRRETHLSSLRAIRRLQLDDIVLLLVIHGIVVQHIAVQPRALEVLYMPADSLVVNIGLMVAPSEVVEWDAVESMHHATTPINPRKKVWTQEVTSENRAYFAPIRFFASLLNERLEVGQVLECVDVCDLQHDELALTRLAGCRCPRGLICNIVCLARCTATARTGEGEAESSRNRRRQQQRRR